MQNVKKGIKEMIKNLAISQRKQLIYIMGQRTAAMNKKLIN